MTTLLSTNDIRTKKSPNDSESSDVDSSSDDENEVPLMAYLKKRTTSTTTNNHTKTKPISCISTSNGTFTAVSQETMETKIAPTSNQRSRSTLYAHHITQKGKIPHFMVSLECHIDQGYEETYKIHEDIYLAIDILFDNAVKDHTYVKDIARRLFPNNKLNQQRIRSKYSYGKHDLILEHVTNIAIPGLLKHCQRHWYRQIFFIDHLAIIFIDNNLTDDNIMVALVKTGQERYLERILSIVHEKKPIFSDAVMVLGL